MDRADALRILNEVIGTVDSLRWQRRVEAKARLDDPRMTPSERERVLRAALEDELRDPAAVERWLTQETGREDAPAGGNGASTLHHAFASRIEDLGSADEAYSLAVELFEHMADLGDRAARELAVEIREACTRLGGNPQHKRFRALGVDRPVRRSELRATVADPVADANPHVGEPRADGKASDDPFSDASTAKPPEPDAWLRRESDPAVSELEAEIRNCAEFADWTRRRQRAQLGVWGGRLRRLRAADRISRDGQRHVYEQLMRLSRTYRPGHVDAFVLKFEPDDWDSYIADQGYLLRAAVAADSGQNDSRLAEGASVQDASEHLERLLELPEHRRHLSWSKQVVVQAEHTAQLAGQDAILEPYVDTLLAELEGVSAARAFVRRLRSIFDTGAEAVANAANTDGFDAEAEAAWLAELSEQERDQLDAVLPFTRGRRTVFLGGVAHDGTRKRLVRLLELDGLDWLSPDQASDTALRGMRRAVGLGHVQMVVVGAGFARSSGEVKMSQVCAESRVPYIRSEYAFNVQGTLNALASYFAGWGTPDINATAAG